VGLPHDEGFALEGVTDLMESRETNVLTMESGARITIYLRNVVAIEEQVVRVETDEERADRERFEREKAEAEAPLVPAAGEDEPRS
jgi:hypothetical protein